MKKLAVIVDCPIDTAINILKGKCKAEIILKINDGVNRFGLLKKAMAVSTKLLAIQLNELEEDGILTKEKVNDYPLQTLYHLTPDGESLCDVVANIKKWGLNYKLFKQKSPALA